MNGEQILDVRGAQHAMPVVTRRVDARRQAGLLEFSQQIDRRFQRGHRLVQKVEEYVVHAVAKPAYRLLEGVLLRAARQRDAPRGEEVGDSVKARPVVDVPSIVVIGEWRVVLVLVRRPSGQIVVERRLPGRGLDRRDVGDQPSKWKITASW